MKKTLLIIWFSIIAFAIVIPHISKRIFPEPRIIEVPTRIDVIKFTRVDKPPIENEKFKKHIVTYHLDISGKDITGSFYTHEGEVYLTMCKPQ